MKSQNARISLVLLTIFTCVSCKTTAPRASNIREEPPGPQVRSIVDDAKPQVLQWVVVEPSISEFSGDEFAWSIDLRTGMEIWCERLCSEFNLVEKLENGVQNLIAVKTQIPGNVNPGILNVKKEIRGSRATVKQVVLVNVGVIGQTVVLEDVITKDKPNFYAVPMMIGASTVSTPNVLSGEFSGKKIEIHLETGVEMPTIVKGQTTVSAFVFGTLSKSKSSEGPTNDIFVASKIIYPWAEE